jgi:hypothetical protein
MKFLVPLVLFGLFWSAIVGAADVLIGGSMLSSLQAVTFERTPGTITRSEVLRHKDSDGVTYSVDVRYTYDVDGTRHEGARYSYSVVSSSERNWADRIVAEHPVGAMRDVHYNPGQPSESVLQPRVDGSTLMMLMFLMPFNAVMVGIWAYVGWLCFQPRYHGVRPPLPTFDRGGATHVRLTQLSWPFAGIIGVGGAAFAGVFLIGLTAGFHPEGDMMIAAWIVVGLVGGYVAIVARRREQAGDFDFSVDQRFVTLPLVAGETRRMQVRKSDVADIEMKITGHDDDTPQYDILVRRRDGETHKLAAWSGEDATQEIVAWLRLRLSGRR